MNRPTVSVVVPVHDGMPHLPETLASILGQTQPADEVVVVENGSTDGTAQWLAEHAPATVRVVRQPALVDAAANWTTAVAAATGDLVKLVCADDVLEPTAVEQQAAALARHPQAVMVASRRAIVDDSGQVVAARRGLSGLRGEVGGRDAVRRCLRRGSNLLGEPAAVMFRRDALVRHLPWDGSLGYVIDLDMYSRVLQDGSLVAVPQPLARFRLSTGSWSAQLAAVQTEHVSGWVARVREHDLAEVGRPDVVLAAVGIRLQALLRRAAYVATRIRPRRARTEGMARTVG